MNNTWLMHYGVAGMKWGVRRYQNKDGSYTKRGLEHYRDTEKRYDDADAVYKQTKKEYREGNATKLDVKEAKQARRQAKKDMEKNYKQLKKDYVADQGKELYRSGKTITGNAASLSVATAIATGTVTTAAYLAQNGQDDLAKYAVVAGASLEAVNGILAISNNIQAKKLRAYYAHKGEYT